VHSGTGGFSPLHARWRDWDGPEAPLGWIEDVSHDDGLLGQLRGALQSHDPRGQEGFESRVEDWVGRQQRAVSLILR
jgi:hypothetical protein